MKIIWALDISGRLVHVEEAQPGGRYFSLDGSGPLRVHAGPKVRKHYHHVDGQPRVETELHRTGKRLVVAAVQDPDRRPSLIVACSRCGISSPRPLLPEFLVAVEEHALGLLRVDVGVLDGAGILALAVEVMVTHPIDEAKQAALNNAGVPWIEVAGADLVADPWTWPAVRCSAPPGSCPLGDGARATSPVR